MSLVRFVLRQCAVAVLTGRTIAGARVFDSRVGPIAPDDFAADRTPILIVRTLKERRAPRSEQNGLAAGSDDTVELQIEAIVAAHEIVGETVTLGLPESDAELEATLDVIEHEIDVELRDGADRPAFAAWYRLAKRIHEAESDVIVDTESGLRLGARILTYSIEVATDKARAVLAGLPLTGDAASIRATVIARLDARATPDAAPAFLGLDPASRISPHPDFDPAAPPSRTDGTTKAALGATPAQA